MLKTSKKFQKKGILSKLEKKKKKIKIFEI
jgi:hypothetical protein